jgi:flagellar hook-basal body complex protein FliE
MLSIPNISPTMALSSVLPQDISRLVPEMPLAKPGLADLTPAGAPTELRPVPHEDSFANMLGRMVDEVNTKQASASEAVSALQSGQNASLHQTVIAMEEANVSFQLMVEVRNKLLESYQELMRMQI